MICFNKEKFRDFIESIEEVDTTYTKGDWDYTKYTKYELRDDGIWGMWYYVDNGITPPEPGERLILKFSDDE